MVKQTPSFMPSIEGHLQTAKDHDQLELYMGECYGGNPACRNLESLFNAFLRERQIDRRIENSSTSVAALLLQSIPDYFQTCKWELRKYLSRTPLQGKDLFTQTVIASILAYRKNLVTTVLQPKNPYPAKDIALAYEDPDDQRTLIYSLNGMRYHRVYIPVTTSDIVDRLGCMPFHSI